MPVQLHRTRLSPAELSRDLAIPDLSDPADGPHAIQQLPDLAVSALAAAWNEPHACQVRWCRGPRVVPVTDNYDSLGYDQADVTRAVRYTRYVDDTHMLRSHATAMVPPALREPPPIGSMTCCWFARASSTAGMRSTGSTQGRRISSTCGGSAAARSAPAIWSR